MHDVLNIGRSSRAEVRNPLLALASVVQAARELPPDSREAFRAMLLDIRAETSWRRHKAPMAYYYMVLSVYAGHLARALRRPA